MRESGWRKQKGPMKPGDIPLGAIDLVTAVVLFLGILRGRRRGLSEELLDMLQWVAIIVLGGMYYRTVSQMVGQSPMFSRVTYNVTAYLIIALVVKLVFSIIKRRLGEKIIGADIFGRCEYYFGMMGAMVRFACVYLFLLNFLHAPLYTAEDLVANQKYQERWFSDIRFPTPCTMQQTVFKESATGWLAERYLNPVLLEPAKRGTSELRGNNSMARRREAGIDALTGGK